MSRSNGHEVCVHLCLSNVHPAAQFEWPFIQVILCQSSSPFDIIVLHQSDKYTAYSGDGVYMFSTHDEPEIKEDASPSLSSMVTSTVSSVLDSVKSYNAGWQKESVSSGAADVDIDESTVFEEHSLSSLDAPSIDAPNVPIIRPRRRYIGARNVATVKDGDPMRSE